MILYKNDESIKWADDKKILANGHLISDKHIFLIITLKIFLKIIVNSLTKYI